MVSRPVAEREARQRLQKLHVMALTVVTEQRPKQRLENARNLLAEIEKLTGIEKVNARRFIKEQCGGHVSWNTIAQVAKELSIKMHPR